MPGAGMPPGGMPPRPMANTGGRMKKDDGGVTTNQKIKSGIARMFTRDPPAQPIKGLNTDPNPNWRNVTSADRVTPDEDAALKVNHPDQGPGEYDDGQKRGGRQKKRSGGETTAGKLDYDGAKKKGNTDPSWVKNDGGSNEDSGEKAGGRQKKNGGGGVPMKHGSGGGLGRMDKVKIYGPGRRG